jgi:hypothetical protein
MNDKEVMELELKNMYDQDVPQRSTATEAILMALSFTPLRSPLTLKNFQLQPAVHPVAVL